MKPKVSYRFELTYTLIKVPGWRVPSHKTIKGLMLDALTSGGLNESNIKLKSSIYHPLKGIQ